MPSLNSSLNMGQRALSMNQRAMHTSGHNIANQQTEGFSRQQVTTQSAPADPLGLGRKPNRQPGFLTISSRKKSSRKIHEPVFFIPVRII